MEKYEKLKEAGYVGKIPGPGKHDYGEKAGTFYGFFLASKLKFCGFIHKDGTLGEKWLSEDFFIQETSANCIWGVCFIILLLNFSNRSFCDVLPIHLISSNLVQRH